MKIPLFLRSPLTWLATLLGLSALLQLWFVFQPEPYFLTHLFPDDSYYYFKIAQQMGRGGGSTFDGVHLTNGYHPLWLWICTAAFQLFSVGVQAMRFLLVIATIMNVGMGYILYSLLRRHTGSWWALLGVVLFVINPWTYLHGLNGMETAVANGFLFLTVFLIHTLITREKRPAWLYVVTSLAAAATVLGRIDYALFVLFLAVWTMWRGRVLTTVRTYLLVLIPGALVLSAWAIYSVLAFGAVIPESGFVGTLVHRELFFYKPRALWTIPVYCVWQVWLIVRDVLRTSGASWLLWIMLGLYSYGFQRVWRNTKKAAQDTRGIELTAVFIATFLIYLVFHGAVRWFGREWYGSLCVVVFPLSSVWALYWLRSGLTSKKFVAVLCAFLAVTGFYFIRTNAFKRAHYGHQYESRQAIDWIAANLPRDARLGSFNSGAIGYYTPNFLVNLDGVVNNSSYEAMKEHRLKAYLYEQKIDYVIDYDMAITYRYASFWGTTDLSFLEPITVVSTESAYHGANMTVYRVKPTE